MRTAAAAGSVLVLLLAGCGWGKDQEQAAAPPRATPAAQSTAPLPSPTAQPLVFERGARSALASGGVGVVDLRDRVGVEPSGMSVNREQTLSGLRWRDWGGPAPTASGDVETLVCDPSCALGTLEHSRATIALSAPRRCGSRRYYSKGSMTYEDEKTGKTRAPAVYLRAPC